MRKREEVVGLEEGEVAEVGTEDVEHAAAVKADAHLGGDDDLGEFETTGGEAGGVDCLEGVGDLDDVRPEDVLGDHGVGVDRSGAKVLLR